MADFEVRCNDCNSFLDGTFHNNELHVELCQKCRDTAYDEGHDDGYNKRDDEGE